MYEQLGSSVEGAQQLRGERFLGGGGREYGLPPRGAGGRVARAHVGGWLRPQPLEQEQEPGRGVEPLPPVAYRRHGF